VSLKAGTPLRQIHLLCDLLISVILADRLNKEISDLTLLKLLTQELLCLTFRGGLNGPGTNQVMLKAITDDIGVCRHFSQSSQHSIKYQLLFTVTGRFVGLPREQFIVTFKVTV